jgi:hypothetical protein
VLDIDGHQLDAVFIDETGVVRDRFEIIKGMTPVGIGDRVTGAAPHLAPSVPNPFSYETWIRYSIPVSGHVNLAIYDVAGRRVTTLADSFKSPGEHVTFWNGRNTSGRRVAGGVYFSVLEFGSERRTRKVLLLK